MLPLQARVDLGVMAMKGYSAFPKATGTSPSDCLVSYPGHSLEGLTPLQRSSRCILQAQPTRQKCDWSSNSLTMMSQFNTSVTCPSLCHRDSALWHQTLGPPSGGECSIYDKRSTRPLGLVKLTSKVTWHICQDSWQRLVWFTLHFGILWPAVHKSQLVCKLFYKKTLCQVLPGGRQVKYQDMHIMNYVFNITTEKTL